MIGWRGATTLTVLGFFATSDVQDQRPTFRGRTDLVSVDVSVRSGKSPVPGLSAADFEVLDNGVAQSVQSLSVESLAIDLTVIVDVSNNVVGSGLANRFASDVRRLGSALRTGDRLRLLEAGTNVIEVVPMGPVPVAPLGPVVRFGGGSSVCDALAIAMMRPPELDRRQLIVVFTQGLDYYSVVDRDDVVATARRADVLVHAVIGEHRVNARGGRIVPPWASVFRDVAEITGGDWQELQDDVVKTVARIVGDFRNRYVLRYTPKSVAPDGWHELTVRVPSKPSYAVRTRKGYFGG